jgi:hypothetical protein
VKLGNEVLHGVMNQVLKDSLFNVDLSK